jgi:hypothetical protein
LPPTPAPTPPTAAAMRKPTASRSTMQFTAKARR